MIVAPVFRGSLLLLAPIAASFIAVGGVSEPSRYSERIRRYRDVRVNLRMLTAAKRQWAMENMKSGQSRVTRNDIETGKYLVWPTGPLRHGIYDLGGTVTAPTTYERHPEKWWTEHCGPAARDASHCPL